MRSKTLVSVGLVVFLLTHALTGQSSLRTDVIDERTLKWADSLLVIPGNPVDQADMSELVARYRIVARGNTLSPEARKRTVARANSERKDKPCFVCPDTSAGKRALAMLIIDLDDRNRQKVSEIAQLEKRIEDLEALLRKHGID